MKKLIKSVFFVSIIICGIAAAFYQSTYMTASQAEKKWGVTSLNKDIFRSGDLNKRAAMAVDIVKKNLYVGQDMNLVRKELGDPDSYFFSATIYAYEIMPFPGAEKENWHLVFVPDKNLEKVQEVKIRKKCCYVFPQ
jgi:hypothetical protein